jgi:hypothetical protein|tara:strand:- start:6514 stop:6777 length:264 start_codon:yes stop_codon:yes gene_type:complete
MVELVVDRSKNKRDLRDDFDNYIKAQLKGLDCKISIDHEDSKSNGCLQVLDFISGAIFRKYEFGEQDFYGIIKEKIILEKDIFVSGP